MADVIIYKKDQRSFNFIIKDGGDYHDLTDASVYLTGRTSVEATASIFDVLGDVTTASEGACQVTLTAEHTATAYDNVVCDVTVVESGVRTVYKRFYLDILNSVKK